MVTSVGGAEFEPESYWTRERVARFLQKYKIPAANTLEARLRAERVAEAAPYLGDAIAHRFPPEVPSLN